MSLDVLTFGCRLNAVESEVIRGHAAGLADTIVVNTCAVTAEAERQCRRAIARAHRERPGARIVVTGCAAQIAPGSWAALPGVYRVLGNQEKLRAGHWRADAPSAVAPISEAASHDAQAVTTMQGRARVFLDVQQGCGHHCTFCIIPQGRGPNRSMPVEAAVRQVRAIVSAGVNEVVLTGVDLASYADGAVRLGGLVLALLDRVPELPRLRLSSLDPAAIDPELWRALAEQPRLMPHLHLSVQAGSDLVLKRMRRRHSRAAALDAIAQARRFRPGIALGADLIAGFPTESDPLFQQTLNFVAEADLPYLHVFPYSERPGTPAARMPQVPVPLRRERAERLRLAALPIAERFHARQLGRTLQVVAERGGVGHSEHFARVRLPGAPVIGSLLEVMATASSAAGLDAALGDNA